MMVLHQSKPPPTIYKWPCRYSGRGDTWSMYGRPSTVTLLARRCFKYVVPWSGPPKTSRHWLTHFNFPELIRQENAIRSSRPTELICLAFLNNPDHSVSAWASPIPFQNNGIDSTRINLTYLSSLYMKIRVVSNKVKAWQHWGTRGRVSNFRPKRFTVFLWDSISFVTRFVEGKRECWSRVDDDQWTCGLILVWNTPFWIFIRDLQTLNTDFVHNITSSWIIHLNDTICP